MMLCLKIQGLQHFLDKQSILDAAWKSNVLDINYLIGTENFRIPYRDQKIIQTFYEY